MPAWTIAAPLLALAILAGAVAGFDGYYVLVIAAGVAGSVFAAVHHAEVVAHRVGEPFGTLVLALAVTLIEVALILSLMIAGGADAAALARDTVFAAVMIILTGIIGLCLLVGGLTHREQAFSLDGVSAALAALTTIAMMTLVFPNFTVSTPGPSYSPSQLILIAAVAVLVYGAFVFTQTVGHRQFFLDGEGNDSRLGGEAHSPAGMNASAGAGSAANAHASAGVDGPVDADAAAGAGTPRRVDASTAHGFAMPSGATTAASAVLLALCLVAVVLLAKKLAPHLETAVARMGAPDALVGVVIAGIVLLPEGLAALRAARQNRLQTSLNLALGSALASIGLTIPAVGLLSLWLNTKLILGIDGKSTVLLVLSLLITILVLRTGRTIILHGIVLLVIFAVYLFTIVVP